MIAPWLLPSKNSLRMSMIERPFFWKAGCGWRESWVIIARPSSS